MNIVAVSGSLRAASFNTALLKTAAELAPDGMTISLADIGDIPLYNGDIDGPDKPAGVTRLVEQIRVADGLLLSTPEYNYSISAAMKNAIDWISRVDNQPIAAKPTGIMGAAMGGMGTSRAQYHLRQVLVFMDARVMNKPELFVSAAHTKFSDGVLTDEKTREFLTSYLARFKEWVALVGPGAR